MPRLDTLRIVGSGGANRAMEAELKRVARRALPGFKLAEPERIDTQTLVYPFDPALAAVAVSYLRTPSRVLWDLVETSAARLEPLYEEVRAFVAAERPPWLDDGTSISVYVPDATDFPASALQLRGTIKNAIIDGARDHGLEVRLDPDDPDVPIIARAVRGTPGFVLGIDLAGAGMHARGYRLEEGEAPLKETLAAQILMLARWDSRTEVLLDPLAGGATIPLEAAQMAVAAPLWVPPRTPAIARVPSLGVVVREVTSRPRRGELFPDARAVIIANEIHTPLVAAARRNIERAGAQDLVAQLHGDLRALDVERLAKLAGEGRPSRWPEAPDWSKGLIVANPPYGKRLERGRGGEDDVAEIYEALRALWVRLPGWRAAFIVAHEAFEDIFGVRPVMKKPMWNGPIRAWLLVYGPHDDAARSPPAERPPRFKRRG